MRWTAVVDCMTCGERIRVNGVTYPATRTDPEDSDWNADHECMDQWSDDEWTQFHERLVNASAEEEDTRGPDFDYEDIDD